MTTSKEWHYAPLKTLPLNTGKYEAWIVATHRPRGRSACAIEIGFKGQTVFKLGLPSRSLSTLWRGYLAAATGVMELLPVGSRVRLCCKHKPLIETLGWVDGWRAALWRKADKKPVSDKEILKRYLSARDGSEIAVEPTRPETEADFDILDSLDNLANEVLGPPVKKQKSR